MNNENRYEVGLEIFEPAAVMHDTVWDYLQSREHIQKPFYGSVNFYIPDIRRLVRRHYLDAMIASRFNARGTRAGHREHDSEPQEFQHEIFWYLVESATSKFGEIRYLRVRDVELDAEMERDLNGIFYGVKSSVEILGRIQSQDRSKRYLRFPQVGASTIISALNDRSFQEISCLNLERFLQRTAQSPRDTVAQFVGRACAEAYTNNSLIQGICSRQKFVGSSINTSQFILEKLAYVHFDETRPRKYC